MLVYVVSLHSNSVFHLCFIGGLIPDISYGERELLPRGIFFFGEFVQGVGEKVGGSGKWGLRIAGC